MAISPSTKGQNGILNGVANGHHINVTNGTSETHAKPRVFALDPLHSEALTLAEKHFDLVLPGDEEGDQWREKAQGLLVRGSYVTAEDLERATSMKGGKLRYISKQGTGVDKIDIANAKKTGNSCHEHSWSECSGGSRACFWNDDILGTANALN